MKPMNHFTNPSTLTARPITSSLSRFPKLVCRSLACALLIPAVASSEIVNHYQSAFPTSGDVNWSVPGIWTGGEENGIPLTQEDEATITDTLSGRKLYIDLDDLHLGKLTLGNASPGVNDPGFEIRASGGPRVLSVDQLIVNRVSTANIVQFLGGTTNKLSISIGSLEITEGRINLGYNATTALEAFTVTGTTVVKANGRLTHNSSAATSLGATDLAGLLELAANNLSGSVEVSSLVGSGTIRAVLRPTLRTTEVVGTLVLNNTNASPAHFAGKIIDWSNEPVSGTGDKLETVRIIKKGTGTQSLGGTNTYTGSTEIEEGTLLLSGSGSINATSGIEINGGTLKTNSSVAVTAPIVFTSGTISGSGQINQTLSIGESQTLSPGNGIGSQTFNGNQKWEDGGNLNWQIYNAEGLAGISYDTLIITGTLDLTSLSETERFHLHLWSLSDAASETGGNAINFESSGTYEFVIATATGGIEIGNPLEVNQLFELHLEASNGTTGFANALHGGQFSVFIQDDNQLVLRYQAIPEPGESALLLMGLAGVASWRLYKKSDARKNSFIA